ncbi:MAG: hypothetical protein AAF479_02125, partial [Pseudomonadota bacterium]
MPNAATIAMSLLLASLLCTGCNLIIPPPTPSKEETERMPARIDAFFTDPKVRRVEEPGMRLRITVP